MHTRGSCLSAPTVLDILESILEAGRGFQRLQLPRDWLTISKSSGAEKGSCSSVIQAFNSRFGGIFHSKTLSAYFGFRDVYDLLNHYPSFADVPDDFENVDPLDGCAFCDEYDQCCSCDNCGSLGCCGCGDQPPQCGVCRTHCCARCAEQVVNPVLHCGHQDCEPMCKECRLEGMIKDEPGYDCEECKSLAFDGLMLGFRSQQQHISQLRSIIDQLRLENLQLRSGD